MVSSIESDIEIKSPADKFFKRLSKELYHVPSATENVHGVEVVEGDFETHGSVKVWSYTIDGKKETFKEKFEIDEANLSVSKVAVGGDVLDQYKSFKITYKVIPKEGNLAVLKISILFEKFKETDPDPTNYLQLLVGIKKDVDAHLVSTGV